MTILTTDRNLKSIGPGLEESGVANEAMEAGDVVIHDGTDQYGLTGADYDGAIGVIKNSYPPEDNTVEADDGVKVRFTGLVIVETATGETVNAGDLLACAGNGKVKAISETSVSGVGSESASGSLLGQGLSTVIGVARTNATGEEELVMEIL